MLIKYSGKYVKMYFNMKITFFSVESELLYGKLEPFLYML